MGRDGGSDPCPRACVWSGITTSRGVEAEDDKGQRDSWEISDQMRGTKGIQAPGPASQIQLPRSRFRIIISQVMREGRGEEVLSSRKNRSHPRFHTRNASRMTEWLGLPITLGEGQYGGGSPDTTAGGKRRQRIETTHRDLNSGHMGDRLML